MVRQNIFEILESKYDIKKEINKITALFNLPLIVYTNPLNYVEEKYTIEQYINQILLVHWKQRYNYLTCEEIKEDLDIPNKCTTQEDIIKILEYYSNLLNLFNIKVLINRNINFVLIKEYYFLIQNIDILIDHLNHEKLIFNEEEKVLLVPKNPAATAVAEISSKNTALAILKYNHASLKGDLEGKRSLLLSIYNEYEPLLKTPLEQYKDFYKKAKQLYNNLNIRHNNTTKKNNKNTIINLDEKELEKWYDELYQLLLFCILIKDNLERKSNVDEFLKTIKGTKGKAEELI